jgi:hypothetical protein
MSWHTGVLKQLSQSDLFIEINLVGGKIRAALDQTRFLDIHYDPASKSYSYALIDLKLIYPGDKRLFGWDDFPHPGDISLENLSTYPHHFQESLPDGRWQFAPTPFRGDIEAEIIAVLDYLRAYLNTTE